MILLGRFYKLSNIFRHFRSVKRRAPHPTGRAPGKNLQDYVRIPFLGFLHQPPLVSAARVIVRVGAHKARLRTVGRIDVGSNFYFEVLKRRTIAGLK